MRNAILFLAFAFLAAFAACLRAEEPPRTTPIKPLWEVKLPPYSFVDKFEEERNGAGYKWCRGKIEQARKELNGKQLPLIPPYVPSASDKLVFAPTIQGPLAYALVDDPDVKPPGKPGELYWLVEDRTALIGMAREMRERKVLDSPLFAKTAPMAFAQQIFGHSLHGRHTHSSDEIFYVCDVGLFPLLTPDQLKEKRNIVHFNNDIFYCNNQYAYNCETGKLRLRWGERDVGNSNIGAFSNSFSLGPALPLNEGLFFVVERDMKLSLIHFDSKRLFRDRSPAETDLLARVALRTASESVGVEFTRRIHAILLTAADKLVLCPTHLGALVAVNRKDNKVAWTAEYGKETDERFKDYSTTWHVTAPLVAGDLCLYAPPDAEALYAFDLKDGSTAWKRERGKGVFPAGLHNGKLIIVERDAVVAVNAADGKELWKVPIKGVLTGFGALNGDRYYLPLGMGKDADEGVIQVIDLKQGNVIDELKRPDKGGFGNLLIHKGKLISQTFETLSVFEMP